MNKINQNKNTNIVSQQVFESFKTQASLNKLRTDSRQKVMEQELNRVTEGKNLLVVVKK